MDHSTIKQMTPETVRANLRMYAAIVANADFLPDELDSLVRYAMEYQSRMGW